MQRRLDVTVSTPAGSGPLTLRCFDSGPRRGFADVRDRVAGVGELQLAIHLVVAGAVRYVDDGGQVSDGQPGTVFFRRPGRRHATYCSHDYGELSIGIARCHLPALEALGYPGQAADIVPGPPRPGAVARFRQLLTQVDEQQVHDSALLLRVAAEAASWLTPPPERAPAALRAIRRLIEADPARPTTLAALAHRAGMGEEALRRAFRRHYGIGPMAYHQRRRLDLALSMLEGSSVREVAQRLGFHDAAAFSRHFKRHFGVAPSRI